MAKGEKNNDVLYRAVKFEIRPTLNQETILQRISSNLRLIWNEAWKERQDRYEIFFKPIYERIYNAKKKALEKGFTDLWEKEVAKFSQQVLVKRGFPLQLVLEQKSLFAELKKAFEEHGITLYDQINALTAKRSLNTEFGLIPRNWQEETLDALDGSFKSFFALRKRGDKDAKPPSERTNEDSFYKIPGRSGFKVTDDGKVIVSFGKLSETLVGRIPEYQQEKLSHAKNLKKFEIVRDERDMAKSGCFWISIAYEIPKPPELPFNPSKAVFLAIGASWIGIISPRGEFCWRMPRPDFHWKPKINAVDERLKRVSKGSIKWKRLIFARSKMFAIMARQQKQHCQYEVIKRLLELGVCFVVTDLKVRSKEGSLADSSKAERGGSPFGANWSAQNTGNIANLVAKLTDHVSALGGMVIKRKSPELLVEEKRLPQEKRKILLAQKLKDEFLSLN